MLGHLGVNVPDLDRARACYGALLPARGFEPDFDDEDQLAFRPVLRHVLARPVRVLLEAVCHKDAD